MLGMATVICLKAVSDAVFLSELDARLLPWLDLVVTAAVALTVNYYLRWSNRTALPTIIRATQIFLVISLVLFWLTLHLELSIGPPLIYLWVGVFAVLIPSQAWSLAGTVFTTRQAKRLFSLIGSGGILGAALGGTFAGYVGGLLGSGAMLLSAAGFVSLSALMAHMLSRLEVNWTPDQGASDEKEKAPILESFDLVRRNRYLLLIALAIFASTVAGTLVKYQFKAVAQVAFEGDRDALTSFTGYFYGYIAVFSFVFHTLFSGRLLRSIGLSGCLFILPFSLGLGMGALAFSATIVTAIIARAADQGFRHSIDRASVELLYIPVSPAVRTRIKSFLDMAVSRCADGLASLVLLALLYVLDAGLLEISVVGIFFVVIWMGLLWRLRGEYVRTLRATIERKDISADTLLQQLAAAGPTEELRSNLRSSDQKDVEAALGWIQLSGPGPEQAQLASLLTHPSATIRRKTMRAIAGRKAEGCEREALAYLELETDFNERRLALDYLIEQQSPAVHIALDRFLDSDDRTLAALTAAKLLSAGENGRAAEVLEAMLARVEEGGGPADRAAAARLIGIAPGVAEAERRLLDLLSDDEPEVVRAALESVAVLRPASLASCLLQPLGDRRFAPEARRALAAYGREAVDAVAEALRAEDPPVFLERQCARVLGAIGGRSAARTLLAYLRRPGRAAQSEVLRALSRIRAAGGGDVFDRETVDVLLADSMERYYRAAYWLDGLRNHNGPATDFLGRAVSERMDRILEEVFVLLSLIFPQREIMDAHSRIASGRDELRANAVEFLDSRLLGRPLRSSLLPAIEGRSVRGRLDVGRELFRLRRLSYPSVLRALLETPDRWLQACACASAAETGSVELAPSVAAITRRSPGGLLGETAGASLTRLREAGA